MEPVPHLGSPQVRVSDLGGEPAYVLPTLRRLDLGLGLCGGHDGLGVGREPEQS